MDSRAPITDDERSAAIGVGMVIAAAIIVRVWGEEVEAQEILGAAGVRTVDDMRQIGVDAYDAWPLRNTIRQLSGRPIPLDFARKPAALQNTGADHG